MSDKLISELVEKTGVVDSDQLPVEGSGGTWRITLLKLREYLFGIFPLFSGATTKNDFLLVKQFGSDVVYRVSLDSVLPNAVVKTKHLEDSVSTGTGIVESKIAPAAVTHSKLSIDSVHTHNIAAAEAANAQNWTSKQFGTGVTTDKIVDGAVTGAKGGVPLGAVFHFASTTAPAGYLACNGSVIPVFDPSNPGAVCENVPVWRLQDLRTFLGSSFGVVGKLPDLRGVFIRGLGQNATQTARTFVKSFSTATLNLLISTLETNDPRASTVSYTLEFYSDAAHLKKLSEQTVPVTQDTFATTAGQFCRVYANKGAASAALGAFQRESMQQHYHGVSDPEHTHGLSGGGISGSVVTSITQNMKYNNDRDGNGTYLKNIGVYTGTGLTYSQPSVVGATTGVAIARQPAEIAGATVDETRPVNAALLPCIKY